MGYTGMCCSTGFLPLWVWNRVYKSALLSGTGYTFCPFRLWNTVGVRVSSEGKLRLTFWNRVSIFTILSGTGQKNCVCLVWNRVRFPGTQWPTPILNWGKYPTPPPLGYAGIPHTSPRTCRVLGCAAAIRSVCFRRMHWGIPAGERSVQH